MQSFNQSLEILKILIEKELSLKYKGTFLGLFWFILNPLLSIFTYYLVFALILKVGKKNYIYYLISGVLIWNFISSSIIILTNSFISYASFIKKLPINRVLIPLALIIANAIPYGILNLAAKILFLPTIKGVFFLSLTFVLIGLQIFFLGKLLGILNSFVKDINYVVSFILNLLFYLSPVVYYIDLVPKNLLWIFYFNPLGVDIIIWHSIFLEQKVNLTYILSFAVHTFLIITFSYYFYNKLEKYLPEVL